jgi:hypothetical protein
LRKKTGRYFGDERDIYIWHMMKILCKKNIIWDDLGLPQNRGRPAVENSMGTIVINRGALGFCRFQTLRPSA